MIPLLWLASCAPGISEPDCPPLVEYDLVDQTRAADELEALPPTSVLPRFMADYAALRAVVRACAGAAPASSSVPPPTP